MLNTFCFVLFFSFYSPGLSQEQIILTTRAFPVLLPYPEGIWSTLIEHILNNGANVQPRPYKSGV
jgi:hypothetical protein